MLCFDWTTEQQAMLTTDSSTTNLWVVPLNNINFNSLEKLRKQQPRCSRVVAFQPTGWTHHSSGWRSGQTVPTQISPPRQAQPAQDATSIIHARRKEGHVIYAVAYSEHSSFSELVDFVATFK
jgi:hypothetical protein